MEIGVMNNFDILFLYEKTLQRLKGCLIQSFTIDMQRDVQSMTSLHTRMIDPYTSGVNQISFRIEGVAASSEMSLNELERVEIVKRIDAYKDLKR